MLVLLCLISVIYADKSLQQKWNTYRNWIELNGGYIHPDIVFKYITSDDKTNRGIFSNTSKTIPSQTILMQIPISVSLTQFMISKYIKNNKNKYNHSRIFGNVDSKHMLPKQFPDFAEFLIKYKKHHNNYKVENGNLLSPSITIWLALGLSWIKKYTNELLAWLSLLPSPNYLPFLFKNKEYLFKETEIEIILNAMEYEFSFAKEYLNILNVSEQSVRKLYALLHSRLFSIDLSHFGGLKNSVAIPCGADFFNHDNSVKQHDFPFYDTLFGDDYYGKMNKNKMNSIIPQIVNSIGKSKVKPIDFMSNYYFVKYPIHSKQEIFGSYGKHSTSVSMALYGFFDTKTINKNDYFNILFKNYNDKQYQYFELNKVVGVKFSVKSTKTLYFTKTDKVSKDLLLMYLTPKYLNSFTISSILNGFEWKYISNVIIPIIQRQIQLFCYDKLMYLYPNRLSQDYKELKLIKKHIKYIKLALTKTDKTIKEKSRLQSILKQTEQQMMIVKYKIREKAVYTKCKNVDIIFG